jgi:apolipoprotein N-acyltransferase
LCRKFLANRKYSSYTRFVVTIRVGVFGLLMRFALCALSGAALALAFPNFGWGLLAWVALVPLLLAIEGQPLNLVFSYGCVQGIVFYGATFYWLALTMRRYVHLALVPAAGETLLVAAVEAVFVGGTLAAAMFITRRVRVPLLATLPIAWAASEWLRSFFPVGFPWNPLGVALHRDLPAIQFSELTGVYGVSALIVLVNVALYRLAFARQSLGGRLWTGLPAAALLLAAIAFGSWRIHELDQAPALGKLRVAMAQGDIPQSLKWNASMLAPSFRVYQRATESLAHDHPDLVVWPETAAAFVFQPGHAYPVPLYLHRDYKERLLTLARDTHEPILFGAPALNFGRYGVSTRNRAYLVSADGRVAGYYDKILLVPFSEYIPFPRIFGYFFHQLVETIGPLTAGSRQTILDTGEARLGVLICYESIFPDFARRAVKAGAEILVNITNDAWYGKTSAPYQLLAMAAMRAVENHTPLVRVGNTGISAVVTPTGRIVGATRIFTRATEIETVEWKTTGTFYSEFGDLFAEACFALLALGVLLGLLAPLVPRLLTVKSGKRAAGPEAVPGIPV